MSTAGDIIQRALTTCGVLASGETADATQLSDGLVSLNDLLESLGLQYLFPVQDEQSSLTLTGASTYTVGSGGTFNITRPLNIKNAFYRSGTTDYPVSVLTQSEYDLISLKSTTGSIVQSIYYNPSYPLGTLYIYPIVSSGTLFIEYNKPMATMAALTTQFSLPPGYERAIRLILADELLAEYGKVNPKVSQMANDASAWIKRVNHKGPVATLNCPMVSSNMRYSPRIYRLF